jgi:glycosyltransferase involved in cell wall biosynthesis
LIVFAQNMKPLRIGHLILSSSLNGSERHLVDLANSQAVLGHEVHVIGKLGSPVASRLEAAVRFHGLLWPFSRGLWLHWLLRRLQIEVCHAHLGRACKALMKADVPIKVATTHVGYKPHHHDQLDGLICLNREQSAQLNAAGLKSRLVYNWVPRRAPDVSRVPLRQELGLRPEQWVVGAVARLHPSKGLDLLVRAFLNRAPQNAVLLLVGEGEQRQFLQQLIGNDRRVRLLGQRDDVDRVFGILDLFVMPSWKESMSLAVLEAMHAGVPIVASANVGAVDALEGQPATLVPMGDIDALGEAIHEHVSLHGLASQQPKVRVSYDMARFDRERNVQQVIDLYRELLAAQRTPASA